MLDMIHDSNVLIVSTKERWLKLHLEQLHYFKTIRILKRYPPQTEKELSQTWSSRFNRKI